MVEQDTRSNDYDPSFEWPGVHEDEESHYPDSPLEKSLGTTSTSCLRLIVVRSAILPSKHRIATLTGYPEIQFGRDKPLPNAVTPRIRLREMEVSKIHATAYWNCASGEWALVDMGSMHGTFWQPRPQAAGSSTSSGTARVRLSPPRVASLPQPLHHLDHVTIGSTTFAVHIHDNELACSNCALAGNEIPMFHKTTTTKSLIERRGVGSVKADPKKSLAMLKQSLLQHHTHTTPSGNSYTDRADRRRRMYGSLEPRQPESACAQPCYDPPPRPVASDPPRRLTSSNVGHGLLTKMGWEPGTTLGLPSADGEHLLDPIQVKHSVNRAGLGR